MSIGQERWSKDDLLYWIGLKEEHMHWRILRSPPPPLCDQIFKNICKTYRRGMSNQFCCYHRSYDMSSLTRIAHKSVLKHLQNPGASGSLKAAPRPRPLRTPLKQILDPPCTDMIHPFYIPHSVLCWVWKNIIFLTFLWTRIAAIFKFWLW